MEVTKDVCAAHPVVQLISHLAGGLSFTIWLVAQLPQTIEIYQNKSVEGLSPLFIGIWFLGDFTSFAGCVLTSQLPFQVTIASYFLLNDVILSGQFYYYKFVYNKNSHHRHQGRHVRSYTQGRKASGGLVAPAVLITSSIQAASALPIAGTGKAITLNNSVRGMDSQTIGFFCAWVGASCYFFSRIPQLLKNYRRKSTSDLSPFLFACTLTGNLTYTISILCSCEFLYNPQKWEFFINELPYMIGSAGTIIFDIIYFYQVWIYRDRDEQKAGEESPLLASG